MRRATPLHDPAIALDRLERTAMGVRARRADVRSMGVRAPAR